MVHSVLVLSFLASTGYEIVGEETLLFVQVYKDRSTLLSSMSHDHVVRAGSVSGTIMVDPDFASCAAAILVPVSELHADEPEVRKRLNLPTDLDVDDREQVKRNMLSEDQLDAAHFPTVVIEVNACKVEKSTGRVNLIGFITIRGKTRNLSVVAEITLEDDLLRARGAFVRKHTEFGFKPYSAALGSMKNLDEIGFEFDAVVKRQ